MNKYIIANWKMNGSLSSMKDYVKVFTQSMCDVDRDLMPSVIVCPAYVYLAQLSELLNDSGISVGGQDCYTRISGAFTGEVSASMLADVGCKYVLVGHSERRKYNGEDESILKDKLISAQHAGLTPVLCIGESIVEYEQKTTTQVLKRQMSIIDGLEGNIILSYEPDWAIGTGLTPKIEEIEEIHNFVSFEYNKLSGRKTSVLYGGSVNVENVEKFVSNDAVGGVLVGGASLMPETFAQLVKICCKSF